MTFTQPVKVFISYSHDSPEHADSVLELSDRLVSDGIDCVLDQYEISPPEGWPRWMQRQISEANFVLMICTEIYYLRVMGQETPGKGRGVRWEGNLIYQHIHDADTKNTRFIPILMENGNEDHIPKPLKGGTFYRLYKEYENLYRHITNQPRTVKPDLGKLRRLPHRERKTDFFVPWNVPYHRNIYFTGREDVLTQLHKELAAGKTAALVQAISGLGGIGKTQTAVEYAYRHRDDYEAVLWSTAISHEALVSDFAAIAEILDLPEKGARDQELAASAVKQWLENSSGWLLILDNADDPKAARKFIPFRGRGATLLTTRARALGEIARAVEIRKMEPEEGALFLLRRAGVIGKDAPLEEASDADRLKAEEISREMDGLPLALDQAGAFIEETPSSLSEYLHFYRTEGAELLSRRGDLAVGHPEPVTVTFSLSLKKVTKSSPAAADLIRLCAFLHPDAIPEEIISEGASDLGDVLGPVAGKPLKLAQMIREACRYSLLARDPDARTLTIHRLVQVVIIEEMDESEQRQWAERAVRAVTSVFPDVEFLNWHLCERLLRHGETCANLIEKWGLEFEEAGLLLNLTGVYLYVRAHYAEAEPLFQCSLEIREKALGKEHPDVAMSLNNLANLYRAQGLYAKAEPLYQRSLEIREKALGKEHPDVAKSLNNLAGLSYAQGLYAKAEPLCQRSLEICEKALGKEHPDVAMSLNNLAELYRAQGLHAKAERLYKRSLAISKKAFGKEHPDVAMSLNNLAELYRVPKASMPKRSASISTP